MIGETVAGSRGAGAFGDTWLGAPLGDGELVLFGDGEGSDELLGLGEGEGVDELLGLGEGEGTDELVGLGEGEGEAARAGG